MFRPPTSFDGSTVTQSVEDGREVARPLNRVLRDDLSGLFDGRSTTRFDPSLLVVSLDVSHIQSSGHHLIALVMTWACCTAVLADVVPWCVANQTGVLVYAPLGSGLLARAGAGETPCSARRCNGCTTWLHAPARRLLPPPWPGILGQYGVTGAICGARDEKQAAD